MAKPKRILFTGGTGKAGRHVVPYLRDRGHRVVNVDLVPLHEPGIDNLTADITDSGQMFNVMTSYAGFDDPLIAGPSSSPVMSKLIEPRTRPLSIARATAVTKAAMALFMSTAPRP